MPSHRAAKHRSPRAFSTAGDGYAKRTALTSGRRRTVAAVVAGGLVLAGGAVATAIHLRAPDVRSQATGTVAGVSAAAHLVGARGTGSVRQAERASRSGTRARITRPRDAVASERLATDGDSSATSSQAGRHTAARQAVQKVAAQQAARKAAAQQAARRAASLQSAVDASQQLEKTLSSRQWVLPTSGFHISVWFGEAGPYWSSGYHTGIDFATACGTPDVAVADATVAQTGWDGAYGNQVRLQLGTGDQVWYNHLSAIEVTTGQHVRQSQEIGRVGETGNAFGCHTHIEYRLASDLHTAVDPLPFFESHGIHLR